MAKNVIQFGFDSTTANQHKEGTIKAGVATVKVLESWGVKHLYGIPGGSINSIMDALYVERENIDYIQVRHEEVGAMAASMHAKYTGHIGVCFGSAGPGGTHTLNGLYDAREEHVPVLALIGQFGTAGLNMDTFQEMNQNPIYADVAIYNRQVSTAAQMPHVIDEAIRQAYSKNGVAVVQIPVNLGWEDIPADEWYSAAHSFRRYPKPILNTVDIAAAVELLNASERPLIFAGVGTRGESQIVMDLCRKIKAPLANTGISFDNFPSDFEALLGSPNRVSTKPSVEVFPEADTVLFVGSNYPFAEVSNLFKNVRKFIQIDIDPAKLGKRHNADVAILGDAGDALRAIYEDVDEKAESGWWRANLANVANWNAYVHKLEKKREGDLQLYQIYDAINEHAQEDAIFSVDVGDVTQTSIRHLHMNPKQMWRTSSLFATMGIGIPGALTAKVDFPDRQVWNLAGDGGFNMVMQDLATEVQYHLPIINVVFANKQYGFIKDEQEDTNLGFLGVQFMDIDYAKLAESMGAVGYTITAISEVHDVFENAMKDISEGKTVLIDAKISGDRPLPAEMLELDPRISTPEQIAEFRRRYEAEDLQPLSYYLAKEGLDSSVSRIEQGGF
ncbi:pyruvate oxidase [Bifidobacterium sp.]|jgi:pyruvate oxidase|uniref:pyruvate oxidase n=1 Tax=Bifidobacterium sp. TaxID=41200 RepID=UPI0025BF0ABF|nr:pyruvate oxidase [Bifidobacterium sp.]MCH4159821.1 pyruvate oxidase [Bifidobacterium sp.]MCH4175013.1 pyruvate oxidase [Bifidobacterium sp.]MCI1636346.1 pyruvate oxidase [Bifidobacterium sp.]